MCRILLIAAGLMLGNLTAANVAPAQERADPQLHEGTVVSASGTQVSIKGADGKEKSFKTNEKTRITVNGKPGKLEDLKPGVMVRVMVDGKGMVTSVSTVDDRKGI
jgi:hypothetical protein